MSKRIDIWFVILIGSLTVWWIIAGGNTTPASEIHRLENSADSDVWINGLNSPDREVRSFARENAVEILPPDSLARIASTIIQSDDPSLRIAGLQILAKVDISGRGEMAAENLDDENADVREAALNVLAASPVESAHLKIIELTNDRDTRVQAAALHALAAMGNPDDLPIFLAFLGKPGSEARAASREGVVAIAPNAPDVVTALLQIAYGGNGAAAREAIIILGEIKTGEALQGLLDYLEFGPVGLLSEAASAIGAIGGEEAGRRVLEIYQNSDPRVQAQAARALSSLGYAPAKDALWAAASDEDEDFWVRHWSLDALSTCGDESLVDGIIELISMENFDPRLVRSGLEALGGIGGEKVIDIYDKIIEGVTDFGLNRQGGETALVSVITGLGKMNSDASRERLREILQTADPENFEILISVVRSLGAVGIREDIATLRQLSGEKPVLTSPVNEAIEAIETRFSPDETDTE